MESKIKINLENNPQEPNFSNRTLNPQPAKEVIQSPIKENNWTKELEKPIYEKWKTEETYKFNKKNKI